MASLNQNFRPLGHLSLKSSVLCPNGGKLTNQYLAAEHLIAHNKKIRATKSAIDTTTPKTMHLSQKLKDQKLRNMLNKDFLIHLATNRTSARLLPTHKSDLRVNTLSYNDRGQGECFTGRLRSGRSENRDFKLTNRNEVQNEATEDAYADLNTYLSDFEKFVRRYRNTEKPTNDLIDQHNQLFTEPKPFQPRLLKSNQSSKITQQNYHNPPPRTKKKLTQQVGIQEKRREADPLSINTKGNAVNVEMNINDESAAELMLLDETLGRSMLKNNEETIGSLGIPRLDITLDADNEKWLQNKSEANTRRLDEKEKSLNSTSVKKIESNKLSGHQMSKEEEELKYIEFMQDITSDIVERGIYADRVLKQIFEAHLARKKGILDIQRMKNIIDKLKVDLGIHLESNDKFNNQYFDLKYIDQQNNINNKNGNIEHINQNSNSKHDRPLTESNSMNIKNLTTTVDYDFKESIHDSYDPDSSATNVDYFENNHVFGIRTSSDIISNETNNPAMLISNNNLLDSVDINNGKDTSVSEFTTTFIGHTFADSTKPALSNVLEETSDVNDDNSIFSQDDDNDAFSSFNEDQNYGKKTAIMKTLRPNDFKQYNHINQSSAEFTDSNLNTNKINQSEDDTVDSNLITNKINQSENATVNLKTINQSEDDRANSNINTNKSPKTDAQSNELTIRNEVPLETKTENDSLFSLGLEESLGKTGRSYTRQITISSRNNGSAKNSFELRESPVSEGYPSDFDE